MSSCHSGSVAANGRVQYSYEICRVSVPVEGKGNYATFCLKVANGNDIRVPILVYRLKGKEIYADLDNETLLGQQHLIGHIKFFEQEALACEELLAAEYPEYTITSVSTVLTYEA